MVASEEVHMQSVQITVLLWVFQRQMRSLQRHLAVHFSQKADIHDFHNFFESFFLDHWAVFVYFALAVQKFHEAVDRRRDPGDKRGLRWNLFQEEELSRGAV